MNDRLILFRNKSVLIATLTFVLSCVNFFVFYHYNLSGFWDIVELALIVMFRGWFLHNLLKRRVLALFTLAFFLEGTFCLRPLVLLLAGKTLTPSILQFGIHLHIVFFLIGNLLFLGLREESLEFESERVFPEKWAMPIIFFIFSVLLTYLSFWLGITAMGVVHANLPYKLEPALNLFRSIVVPATFCFFINESLSSKNTKKGIVIRDTTLFIIWILAEFLATGSRGIIFFYGIFLLLIYSRFLNFRSFSFSLLLVFIIGAVFFSLGHYVRHVHMGVENPTLFKRPQTIFLKGTNRLFKDLELVQKFSYLRPSFLDLEHIGTINEKGGSVEFHTYVVDKVKLKNIHSSGITALSDAYLYFGEVGVLLTLVGFIVFCFIVDFGFLPIFRFHFLQALVSFSLLKTMMWGEGFYGFYFGRSIYTIAVFPMAFFIFYLLLSRKPFLKKNSNGGQ